jgi:hypothetical protein
MEHLFPKSSTAPPNLAAICSNVAILGSTVPEKGLGGTLREFKIQSPSLVEGSIADSHEQTLIDDDLESTGPLKNEWIMEWNLGNEVKASEWEPHDRSGLLKEVLEFELERLEQLLMRPSDYTDSQLKMLREMSEVRVRLRQLERKWPQWGFDKGAKDLRPDSRVGNTCPDLVVREDEISGQDECLTLHSKQELGDSVGYRAQRILLPAKDTMASPKVHPSSPDDKSSIYVR